jgi:hypothetical protein
MTRRRRTEEAAPGGTHILHRLLVRINRHVQDRVKPNENTDTSRMTDSTDKRKKKSDKARNWDRMNPMDKESTCTMSLRLSVTGKTFLVFCRKSRSQ